MCADGDLAEGEIRRVPERAAIVCRSGGRLYAFALRCPHSGALLTRGRLAGDCLECPLHGARFALGSGAVRRGPARRALPTYDVVVIDDVIYLKVRR